MKMENPKYTHASLATESTATDIIKHQESGSFPLPTVLNHLNLHRDSPVLKQLEAEHVRPSVRVPTNDGTLKIDSVTEADLAYLVRNAGTADCKRLQKWEPLGLLPVVMALHSKTNPAEVDQVAFDSFFRKVPKGIKALLPRPFFQSIYQLLKHLASDVARRELRRLIDKVICSEVATHLTPQQRKRYLALKGSKARRYKFLAREARAIFAETVRGVQALAILSQGSMEQFRNHMDHVFYGREQLYLQFRDPN
ncbi:MAG TPA: hypothetical protein PKX00_01355 [Opitutaceae bacterium]|nr:hypothetical protein [Opitutaceae bacterium]